MSLPNKHLDWPIPYEAVCLVADTEGLRLEAYLCPAGVLTIGRGRTRGVKQFDTCTVAMADQWLCEDLTEFRDGVLKHVTRTPTPNQLGAMTSFAYNIGLGGFARSTVLRMHNAGDHQAAARAFALWNKAKGKVLNGLTARRAREAALYLTDDEVMVQEVDPESQLTQSPIAQAGAVSVTSGALAVAATFGDSPTTALITVGIVSAISGLVAILQRKKQRDGGWA
jgi:GH24 family phage-related lysozyme (muramidase)